MRPWFQFETPTNIQRQVRTDELVVGTARGNWSQNVTDFLKAQLKMMI
jgi:hypothetical protein